MSLYIILYHTKPRPWPLRNPPFLLNSLFSAAVRDKYLNNKIILKHCQHFRRHCWAADDPFLFQHKGWQNNRRMNWWRWGACQSCWSGLQWLFLWKYTLLASSFRLHWANIKSVTDGITRAVESEDLLPCCGELKNRVDHDRWPGDQVTRWPDDRVTEWLGDWVRRILTKRNEAEDEEHDEDNVKLSSVSRGVKIWGEMEG